MLMQGPGRAVLLAHSAAGSVHATTAQCDY